MKPSPMFVSYPGSTFFNWSLHSPLRTELALFTITSSFLETVPCSQFVVINILMDGMLYVHDCCVPVTLHWANFPFIKKNSTPKWHLLICLYRRKITLKVFHFWAPTTTIYSNVQFCFFFNIKTRNRLTYKLLELKLLNNRGHSIFLIRFESCLLSLS